MRADRSVKVSGPSRGTPQRAWARSSMAISSVSTFHDHRPSPAASLAVLRRSAFHTGASDPSHDIPMLFPPLAESSKPPVWPVAYPSSPHPFDAATLTKYGGAGQPKPTPRPERTKPVS